MEVCVINLDRSSDRLAEYVANNRHLTYLSRFPAIDGQQLNLQDLATRKLIGEDVSTFTPNAIGCAMSHICLWDKVIETGKILTISEDDAILNSRFDFYANEIIRNLPADWDFILWGWNFDLFLCFEMLDGVSSCLAQFDHARMCGETKTFQNLTLTPRTFKLLWCFGIPCYALSPKGAQELRRRCVPLRNQMIVCPEGMRARPYATHFKAVGIDNVMNGAYRELNAYVCFPPLAITTIDHARSTIGPRS